MANLWIIDEAKVKITPDQVLLQIKVPTRSLPRDEAFKVADKEWFKAQMEIIEQTRKKGETAEIPMCINLSVKSTGINSERQWQMSEEENERTRFCSRFSSVPLFFASQLLPT